MEIRIHLALVEYKEKREYLGKEYQVEFDDLLNEFKEIELDILE